MQQGMVRFPKQAEWATQFVSELLQFPLGKHDDQVDAIAWIGQLLDLFSTYVAPKPKKKPSWRDKIRSIELGSTRARNPMTS
jgi:hypothetical protein